MIHSKPSSSTAAEIPPEAYPYSSDEPLVGIERRGKELRRLILNNESRDVVISVLGGAGSGKTTLIYEVHQIVKVTFECHAWVPVSRSCEGMLERIWEALELPAYQGTDRRRCLHTYLQQKMYIQQKLLYLLVDARGRNNAIAGVEVSQGIGCLKWLQKLSLIKANNKNGSIVEELGNLIELRKLGITELKNKDSCAFCASIEKMENLSSLYVESTNEFLDLNHVKKSPQMIENLFLGGRLHNIPEWILSLKGLFKLELKWSQLAESPLEVLWDLPSLKVLHLHGAYSGEAFEFRAGWFLELRILVIEQFRWLKRVVIPRLAVPKLQMLTIENCNCLTMVRIAAITLDHLKKTNVPERLLEFSEETIH